MKPCPGCQANLEEVRVGDFHVDGCNSCGGVWFDHRELTMAAEQTPGTLKEMEERFWKEVFNPEHKLTRLCPVCKVKLVEFEFFPRYQARWLRKLQGTLG